jgi:hypothetical protein
MVPSHDKAGNDLADRAAKKGAAMDMASAPKEDWPQAWRWRPVGPDGVPVKDVNREQIVDLIRPSRLATACGQGPNNATLRINAVLTNCQRNLAVLRGGSHPRVGRGELSRRLLCKMATAKEQKMLTRGPDKDKFSDRCVLCGQADSHWHRLVGCQRLQAVRNAAPPPGWLRVCPPACAPCDTAHAAWERDLIKALRPHLSENGPVLEWWAVVGDEQGPGRLQQERVRGG